LPVRSVSEDKDGEIERNLPVRSVSEDKDGEIKKTCQYVL
jgi:hypothetical protein